MITTLEKLYERLDPDEVKEIVEKTHCRICGIDLDDEEMSFSNMCSGCRDSAEEMK